MNQAHFQRWSGILAVCFYVTHAVYWIMHDEPSNLLWACHLGALLVGLGCLFQLSLVISIGLLWLVLGNIFWFMYLFGGGEFIFTSSLTHIGGIIVGLYAIKNREIPEYSWVRAVVALATLQLITRFATAPGENVNLAFRVHEGWENIFPVYSLYILFLLFLATLIFYVSELMLRKLLSNLDGL